MSQVIKNIARVLTLCGRLDRVLQTQALIFKHYCQSQIRFTASTGTELPCLCRPDIPVYAGADEPLLAHSMDAAHQSQSVVS